jgi:hypothetical protein
MYSSPEHFGRQSGLCWTAAKFPPTLLAPPCLCLNFWLETNECYATPSLSSDLVLCDFVPFLKVKKLLMVWKFTVVRHLTMGIRSEKCIFGRFLRRANIIECTYTNLGSAV